MFLSHRLSVQLYEQNAIEFWNSNIRSNKWIDNDFYGNSNLYIFFFTGTVTFHVRRRPVDLYPRKRKKKPIGGGGAFPQFNSESALMSDLPILVELNMDGSDIHSRLPQRFRLSQNVTEVGSDPNLAAHSGGHALVLPSSPFIHPR